MIILLCGRVARRSFITTLRRLGRTDVTVLTPADLSRRGWSHDPHRPQRDTIGPAGRARPASRVGAVVTALDQVEPVDLPHVHPHDQLFVAQEMSAYLRSWLATTTVPVIERPTPMLLSGAAGDPSLWSEAAVRTGVRDGQWWPQGGGAGRAVTIVDGRVVRSECTGFEAAARDLVAAAGVPAARLSFATHAAPPTLVRVSPWWHSPSVVVVDALLRMASVAVGDRAQTGAVEFPDDFRRSA